MNGKELRGRRSGLMERASHYLPGETEKSWTTLVNITGVVAKNSVQVQNVTAKPKFSVSIYKFWKVDFCARLLYVRNPLMQEVQLANISKFISYPTEKALLIYFKEQSVDIVYGSKFCLF